jgi:hypothetical protein
MQLRRLQQEFQRHLLGVQSAIAGEIVDAPPLPATDRLAIYRNAYQVRLIEALEETHPNLHKVLGDEVFVELGEEFIAVCPSVHRSIRWYGRELADFLAQHFPYSQQPILAEIARFEWTLSEVFDADDAVPVDREALNALDPAAWSDLKLRFHPSVRRLDLAWNTVAVWQAMSRDESPPQPELTAQPVRWLLWRRNLQNFFRSMDAIEDCALDAALAGMSFGELCAALTDRVPEKEIPLRAATFLSAWADSGIIAGF